MPDPDQIHIGWFPEYTGEGDTGQGGIPQMGTGKGQRELTEEEKESLKDIKGVSAGMVGSVENIGSALIPPSGPVSASGQEENAEPIPVDAISLTHGLLVYRGQQIKLDEPTLTAWRKRAAKEAGRELRRRAKAIEQMPDVRPEVKS